MLEVVVKPETNQSKITRATSDNPAANLECESFGRRVLVELGAIRNEVAEIRGEVAEFREEVNGHCDEVTENRSRASELIDRVTPRQVEVLKLIAAGRATKQIALELNISVKTVETHRSQLMERLGVHDVAGLVRLAIKAGVSKLDR
ncbi:MAG: response regulator transcription factor [Acidobacteriota bacterium]